MMATEQQSFARVRPWLLNQLNGSVKLPQGMSDWQKGCPSLIPGLRSHCFWATEDLPWIGELEAQFPAIKAELLALRGQNAFKPYRAPVSKSTPAAADGVGSVSHDSGDWNVYYLYLHNMDFNENRARCPETCRALEAISGSGHYSHAMFSALAPGTHITKHNGIGSARTPHHPKSCPILPSPIETPHHPHPTPPHQNLPTMPPCGLPHGQARRTKSCAAIYPW